MNAFQKAVDLDPDLSEAHNSLGGVWLEGGELRAPNRRFEKQFGSGPITRKRTAIWPACVASAGRFDEALYHFDIAIRLKPDFAAARFNYGVALAKMNRLDEAKRQIEAALRYNPNFREAQQALQILQQSLHSKSSS